MKLKKFVSGILTAAMVGTMLCSTAFAAASDTPNGTYTGEIHFLNANGSGNKSMCDSIFAHEADVVLTDDAAELTFYVAYPVPSFADQGTDGTIKDVVLTYDSKQYTATSDITSKPEKTFDTAGALFGINAGDVLPTQKLTVELPRNAVDNLEAGTLACSAYVNVVMNTTQNFFIQVTGLPGAQPAETHDMEITGTVEEPISVPSYTVTVPESVAMGTLSAETDNTKSYKVNVVASDLAGTLSVTAPGAGSLTNAENTLAFANSFGTQNVTADTTGTDLTGEISVKATDVADAVAGNYTGTTTFSITYTAN